MADTAPDIDRKKVAHDFDKMFSNQLPRQSLDSAVAHLGTAPKAVAASSYGANGSIASLILYTKCVCEIDKGKRFEGSTWGIAVPGGGALFGDVYTDDIDKMYAKTSSFALAATPVYTSFVFMDDGGNALGSFQAGSVSTVAGTGGGSGHWS